jgi:hypothetical protein
MIDEYAALGGLRIGRGYRMRSAGHVARMGEDRNAYRILVGNP